MTSHLGIARHTLLAFGVVFLVSTVIRSGEALSDLPVMDGVPTAAPEDVGMSSARLERLEGQGRQP